MIISIPEGYKGINCKHFTCTELDLLTVITTKDQSGEIYNNYSTGGQRFMAVVNKPLSSGYALGLGLFTAINPWHCAITITKVI